MNTALGVTYLHDDHLVMVDSVQVLSDPTTTYVYGPSTGSGVRIAQANALNTEYFLTDGLGSVRQLANSAGSVTLAQRYDPFGNPLSSAGSGTSVYSFAGEARDATGLAYLRARYYAPTTGRFTTRDVWDGNDQQPMSYNPWLYVYANPVNRVDPSGHCPKPPANLGSGKIICFASFIATQISHVIPGIAFKGDDRNFSSDSSPSEKGYGGSRFWAWIDAKTGEKLKEGLHETCYAPGNWLGEDCTPPNRAANSILPQKMADGTIKVEYHIICSVSPWCQFGPDGTIAFVPNDFGSFDTVGTVEAFGNLEAYYWVNGKLENDYLFRFQAFSPEELKKGEANPSTAMNMLVSDLQWQAIDDTPYTRYVRVYGNTILKSTLGWIWFRQNIKEPPQAPCLVP